MQRITRQIKNFNSGNNVAYPGILYVEMYVCGYTMYCRPNYCGCFCIHMLGLLSGKVHGMRTASHLS